MRSSTSLVFSAIALSFLSLISFVVAQNDDPNKICPAIGPFKLRIQSSSNPSLVGQYITNQHIGGGFGYEIGVLGGKKPIKPFLYDNFTTIATDAQGKSTCTYGNVNAVLPNWSVPIYASIYVQFNTNIAQLRFTAYETAEAVGQFTLSKSGVFGVNGWTEWYVCSEKTMDMGPYWTVNLKIGGGAPDDETCQSVKLVKA